MSPRDFADMLVRKALQDLFVVEALVSDPEAPDEIIGFHVQQAVEKLMKAVLADSGTIYRPTHNLHELRDLLVAAGVDPPVDHEDFPALLPYAATLRYDDLDLEDREVLDRTWALGCILRTRTWAESRLGRRKT